MMQSGNVASAAPLQAHLVTRLPLCLFSREVDIGTWRGNHLLMAMSDQAGFIVVGGTHIESPGYFIKFIYNR